MSPISPLDSLTPLSGRLTCTYHSCLVCTQLSISRNLRVPNYRKKDNSY